MRGCGLRCGERTSGRAEADDGTPERISLPADALLRCIRPSREVTAKSVLVGWKNKCKIVIIITISHKGAPNYNINILIYFHLFSRIHGGHRVKIRAAWNDHTRAMTGKTKHSHIIIVYGASVICSGKIICVHKIFENRIPPHELTWAGWR